MDLLDQEPTTILVDVPRRTPIPDTINTLDDTTEAFKTIVSRITKDLPFIIAPISYELKTMLLHLEDLNQELINAAAAYKASVPHPKKYPLLGIYILLKILNLNI